MKNKLFTIFLCIMMIGLVSALDFDNFKTYNEELKLVTITNNFGLGDIIGQARLNTPQNVRVGAGYQKVAELDIWVYRDYNDAIKQFTFIDLKNKKKINRDFDIKMLKYEEVEIIDYIQDCYNYTSINGTERHKCDDISVGTHFEVKEEWTKITPSDLRKNDFVTIGIFTEVQVGDYIDWIPTIFGKEVEEWATWTADLNTDLISYWKFDEEDSGSGTIIDELGNHNGINLGADNVTGKIGYGYDFVGSSSDHINLGNVDILGNANGGAISLWINWDGGTACTVFSKWTIIGDRIGCYITGTTLKCWIGDDSSGNWRVLTNSFTTNTWHNIIINHKSSDDNTTYYLDGNLMYSEIYDYSNSGADLFISGFTTELEYFDGTIDEVAVWNRELTTAEITQLNSNITYIKSITPIITANTSSPTEVFSDTNWLINLTATSSEDAYIGSYTQFYVNDSAINGVYYYNLTNNTNHQVSSLLVGNFSIGDNLTAEVWVGNSNANSSKINLTTTVSYIPILNVTLVSPENNSLSEALEINFTYLPVDNFEFLKAELYINSSSILNFLAYKNLIVPGVVCRGINFKCIDANDTGTRPDLFTTKGCLNSDVGIQYWESNATKDNYFNDGIEIITVNDGPYKSGVDTLDVLDLDNDGQIDVVAGGESTFIAIAYGNASRSPPFNPQVNSTNFMSSEADMMAVGHSSDPILYDIFDLGEDGKLFHFVANNSKTGFKYNLPVELDDLSAFDSSNLITGYVSNETRVDIFPAILTGHNSVSEIYGCVYNNSESDNYNDCVLLATTDDITDLHPTDEETGFKLTNRSMDINGDNLPDIVWVNGNESFVLISNSSQSDFYNDKIEINSTYLVGMFDAHFYDFNKDGVIDLLVSDVILHKGFIFLGNTSEVDYFNSPMNLTIAGEQSNDTSKSLMCDANEDGVLDLFMGGSNNWQYYEGQETTGWESVGENTTIITNNTNNNISYTLPNYGIYFWNILLTNSLSNSTFALENYTIKSMLLTDNSPNLTINLPANATVITTNSINVNATDVFDNFNLTNVSVNLDGIINQTNSSGLNNSLYNFLLEDLSEGWHNWSITATDNASQSTTTATRWFNVDTSNPITLTLQSPDNATTWDTPLVNITCNSYAPKGITQLNMTLNGAVNQTKVNVTQAENLSISKEINLSEGDYIWSCATKNLDNSTTSVNRTFTVAYSSPTIDISTPSNNTLTPNTSINFYFNASDLNGIKNVTLYIDGVINETNTSGIDGFYLYSKGFSVGNYNWSILAYSNLDKSTNSGTYFFEINETDRAPIINITSPLSVFDLIYEGYPIDLNWTVTDESLDRCWYEYGSRDILFEDNGTLPEGVLNYDARSGGINIESINYTFELNNSYDLNLTYLNLTMAELDSEQPPSPTNPQVTSINNYSTENCSTYNINLNITCYTGFTISCNNEFYCGSQLIANLTTTKSSISRNFISVIREFKDPIVPVSCSANHTTFDYIIGENSLNFFANDTLGNESSNSVDIDYKLYYMSENYSNITSTGKLEDFSLDIILGDEYDLNSANLIYGNDTVSANIISSGQNRIVYVEDFQIPTDYGSSNVSFYWSLLLDDLSEVNTTSQNQSVTIVLLDNCSTYTNKLFNINLYDEQAKTDLLGDIEFNYLLLNYPDYDEINNINLSFTNVSNVSICSDLNLSEENLFQSIEIRYISDNHVPELFHIQRAEISSSTQQINLYDLNSSFSTEFKLTYQDSTFNFVDGAIIQLQRKYISENLFETVEAPITSNSGTSIVHVDLNSIKYRVVVVKNGVILDTFENVVFSCESELTGECSHKLLGSINPQNDRDISDVLDFSYMEPIISGNEITIPFTVPSGSPASINIVLEQKDEFGNTTLCNKTVITSSGSISCNYSDTLGDSYIDLSLYKNSEPMAIKSYVLSTEKSLDWLGNNYIFILILLFSLIGMALASPEWIVINGIITLVISGALYLASGLDFVKGLGTIMWLIIAGIILISKMSKQEDR